MEGSPSSARPPRLRPPPWFVERPCHVEAGPAELSQERRGRLAIIREAEPEADALVRTDAHAVCI